MNEDKVSRKHLLMTFFLDDVKLVTSLSSSDIAKWQRPDAPAIDSSCDPLIFQQLDVDHYIDGSKSNMLGLSPPEAEVAPVFRMFGLSMEGHSIVCYIHGFLPYFYVQAMRGFQVSNNF